MILDMYISFFVKSFGSFFEHFGKLNIEVKTQNKWINCT